MILCNEIQIKLKNKILFVGNVEALKYEGMKSALNLVEMFNYANKIQISKTNQ